MTHPEDLLADHVSGSLAPADRAVVDAHLATCAACSAEVSLALAARSALRTLPEVAPPDDIAARALETPTNAGPPSWYRWVGAAAAAAVVALVLVSLPHLWSTPGGSGQAESSPGISGGFAPHIVDSAIPVQLTVQQTNYDQTSLDSLTAGALQGSPAATAMAPTGALTTNATPKERIGSSAELQTALACVGKAVPTSEGTPFKLILARFDGKTSFLAFYYRWAGTAGAPIGVIAQIVDGTTCTTSGSSSAFS